MAASDRLYELSCEVHDCEERLDRMSRECQDFAALKRACGELVETLEEDRLCGLLPAFSNRTAAALFDLKHIVKS